VRVSRIAVRDVAQTGGAELELAVVARNTTDITGMLGAMAQGRTFSAALLTENKSDKGIESTLRVRYTPGAARPVQTTDAVESAARSNSVSPTSDALKSFASSAQGEAR